MLIVGDESCSPDTTIKTGRDEATAFQTMIAFSCLTVLVYERPFLRKGVDESKARV